MRTTAELYSKDPRRPALVTVASPVGQTVGPLGVVEPYARMRDLGVSPPRAQAATRKWALSFRPEELYTNLRPGLPCWLAWYAVQRGWPLAVVVAERQLERAPTDIQHMLIELYHLANRTHTTADVFQRDALISGLAPVVGIEDIMAMRLPIMSGDVLTSPADERTESEVDYGRSDRTGDPDPKGS